MKFLMKLTLVLGLVSIQIIGAQQTLDANYFESLKGTHDLSLPKWGPYTKKYIGLSHIPKIEEGIRFDFSVFPGLYRRKITVPNVNFESGFHPWEASPNLEYFSFRHEIIWKDQLYTDVSYSKVDDNARLVRIACVNNTEGPQSMVVHLMTSIHFPSPGPYQPHTPLEFATVSLPEYATWTDASNYTELNFAQAYPKDQLTTDGMLKGEIRGHGFVNGNAIGKEFGNAVGDEIVFKMAENKKFKDATLVIRYKSKKEQPIAFELDGIIQRSETFEGVDEFTLKQIKLGSLNKISGDLRLKLKTKGKLIFDGFTLIENEDLDQLKFEQVDWKFAPEIIEGPTKNSMILKYKNIDNYYGISWDYPEYEIRQWHFKNLSDGFKHQVNAHTQKVFKDGTKGHFMNVFMRPIHLQPKQTLEIDGMVYTGSLEQVKKRLSDKVSKSKANTYYEAARSYLNNYDDIIPDGKPYIFSQQRMAANTITNVVYPVYTQQQYIRHHAPGRWWDSLYTWDAGFIGLGLGELSLQRGMESLNTYVNEPEEASAFIHHGTPLPVQHYLFQDLWNKTQNLTYLKNYYPKLKKYYEFISGVNPSSTTKMPSNLLKTWDYFYNSGGWDDYPPQKNVHAQGLRQSTTPVVTTAHAIRIAKILKMAARHLEYKKDIKFYQKQIDKMATALQKYAWDENTGYYGYVTHNTSGTPIDIMKYKNKVNYNMGLGGTSPLVSGIATPKQQQKMVNHLKNPKEIWTDVGLSAVDQSAPYFKIDGYWNGTVWMPHQWFMWKAMLDIGEDDFAYKIAKTALEVWKRETEDSYNCYEHFVIASGKGAGWHQFSGLSAPVLAWFNAYFKPGTLTTGLDAWITNKTFNKTNTHLKTEVMIEDQDADKFSLVVCMNPNYVYEVFWNGKIQNYNQLHKGTLSITLSKRLKSKGLLEVRIKQ